jgi:hypothetical protein
MYKMSQRLETLSEVRREYRRFNTVGTQLTVRLIPPPELNQNPVDHFVASVKDLFENPLQDVVSSFDRFHSQHLYRSGCKYVELGTHQHGFHIYGWTGYCL